MIQRVGMGNTIYPSKEHHKLRVISWMPTVLGWGGIGKVCLPCPLTVSVGRFLTIFFLATNITLFFFYNDQAQNDFMHKPFYHIIQSVCSILSMGNFSSLDTPRHTYLTALTVRWKWRQQIWPGFLIYIIVEYQQPTVDQKTIDV